jgi:RND family efflux transporter MFP subunit
MKKMKHRVGLYLAAGIMTLALGGAPAGVQAQERAEGITEPFLDIVVGAPVPGTIARTLVKEGDPVKKGQRIVELVKMREELDVKRRKLIWESTAELDAAKLSEQTLKQDFEATRKLFSSTSSVSKDELARKELEYNQAVAERLRLEIAENREEIDYEIALDALKLREIDAPLSGQVVERLLDEGEACGAQEPLLRIVDSSRCYLTSNVDAKLGPRFKLDQEVKLEVQAGTGFVNVTGKVSFISPVVDPSSGLLKIRLLFDNQDGKVRPGVEGRMIIPTAR